MRTVLSGAVALLIFVTATSCFAQGDAFTDEASFDASLTGSLCLEFDYSSIGAGGDQVFGPVVQPFGSFDFIDSNFFPSGSIDFPTAGTTGTEVNAISLPNDNCLVINFDSAVGQLDGFGFEFVEFSGIQLTVFDTNNNVVCSHVLDGSDPFADPDITGFFGWTNTDGVDVDRVELCSEQLVFGIAGGKATFIEDVSTDCSSMLAGIVTDLEALLPTGDSYDDNLIQCAIDNLNVIQDPIFWSDDNRLSGYGLTFFLGANYATCCLDYVNTVDVQQQLTDIQAVLSCIATAEIQAAIDRGGDQSAIDYAIYLEGCAQAFEDAGLFYEAVFFRKHAWVFAFLA